MKVTRTMLVRGSILLAMALLPTLQAVGQGPTGGSGLPGAPGTYPYAPAYYDEPFVGYQSQSAFQTGSQRDAAATVLENNIGYSVRAPFGPRLTAEGIFGDRRGIDGNDYSVMGFLPWHIDPNRNLVYAIARGTATDLGDFVGNFGLGHRVYIEEWNRIFGINGWYDIDDTHNQTYHRGGLQLEYIGRYLEIRGGADIVLNDNRQLLGSGVTGAAPFFRANSILFTTFATQELAYDQAYAEAGGPLPFLGRYGVNGYAGAYYIWHDDADEALGYSLRASADITRDVQVGVRHTDDDIFGATTSVNVALSFPNGGLKQIVRSPRTVVRGQTPNLNETNQALKLRPGSVASMMGSNPVRDHRTPVDIVNTFSNIAAIDPLTGAPVCVTHVDPNATVQGVGTFESPFRTLEGARLANDGSCRIIRVVPREDGTGMNLALAGTFNLFQDQRLLGSSVTHTFDSTLGTFALPGYTGPGPGPLVMSAVNGNLINMGNNTEVSGFQLVGSATGSAIVGSPVGFDINRNEIRDSLNGILLTNATGTGVIDSNTVTDSVMNGIAIMNPGGGTLNLTANNNVVSNSGTNGVNLAVNGGVLNGTISNNNVGGSGVDGMLVTATGASTVAMAFTNNVFGTGNGLAGNMDDGFDYNADSGTNTLTFLGNSFGGNMDDGADVNLTGMAVGSIFAQNNVAGGGLTVMGNVNISRLPGDQDESTITVNPLNPNQLFASSNNGVNGVFAARSNDGGQTWLPVNGADFAIADGGDALPTACCDPSVSWDQFGNLFLVYLDATTNNNIVAVSTDGGQTLQTVATLTGGGAGGVDQPTLVTGPGSGGAAGSVWVTYRGANGSIVVEGAAVTGLGTVGAFSGAVAVPGGAGQNFGDIVVGPNGQVVVTYQDNDGDMGPDTIKVNTDTDGLANGLNFGAQVVVTGTNVGDFDSIPPQANRTVDAEAGLAYDRSGGQFDGRLYMVYTDENPDESDDTDIMLRFSDDDGATWSAPTRVNDDAGTNSQFLPRIAVDQTTGNIAMSWYDSRNDLGLGGTGDTNNILNDDAQFFATVSFNGGQTLQPNVQISQGTSNSASALNPGQQYGDYTGLAFQNGSFYPTWADNSNSTGDNPNGMLSGLDVYTSRVMALTGGPNGGDGFEVTLTDNAVLMPSTFDSNFFSSNTGIGLNVTADGSAVAQNVIVTNNQATANGTGAMFTTTNGGTITLNASGNNFSANVDNNTGFSALATGVGSTINIDSFLNNTVANNMNGNGVRLEALLAGRINVASFAGNSITGNGMNGVFARSNGIGSIIAGGIGVNGGAMNVINSNAEFGIDFEASSGGSILGPGGAGNFTIVNNVVGATGLGNGLGGINAIADSNILPPSNSVINLSIGGPTAGDGNSIVNNMDSGISFLTRTFAQGTVLIQNNVISDTVDNAATAGLNDAMGDGILLDRADTSLLTATVLNNMSMDNENDGMRVITRGDDPTNVSQPMSGTANMVTFNSNSFTGNMRHGASFSVQADSVLVANGMLNEITGNMVDGVNIASSGDAGFGNPAVGTRSIFDGNNISMNMGNGVGINSTDSSRVFLSIQSSDAVAQTTIMDNTLDGVSINQTSDANSDIIIQSDPAVGNTMFRTLITNNGDATGVGGNGIDIFNAAGASIFTVQRTDITSNNAGMMAENGNGISLNNVGGAPTYVIGSPIAGGAIATLGLGNTVQSNDNDALAITVTDVGILGNAPTFEVAQNIFGARIGELTGGNLGNGVDFQVLEPTSTIATAQPVSTFLDNVINRNTLRGVNIFLRGDAGFRSADGATMQFIFADGGTGGNQIMSNGQEGIFYEADPGIHQQRLVTLSNNGFVGNNRPAPFSAYAPFVDGVAGVSFTAMGDIGDDYSDVDAFGNVAFLNLITDNNSFVQITDNTIQNNGAGGVSGDGVYIRVGTNAYVAADVQGNSFGGNLLDDFRTESFITRDDNGVAIQTNASVNRTGLNTVDDVFLDDTAQFDLRFNNNTGNQINASAFGATYNPDTLKITGDTGRFVGLFQVDDGFNLNDPNNTFVQFGMTQDVEADFLFGGYWQRLGADGLFPNAGFPDDFPGGFARPFLP